MSVTFAGVPLLTPSRSAVDWVEQNLPPSAVFQDIPIGKNRQHFTVGGPTTQTPISLGTLTWPQGASRWATGYYLVTADQLALIRQQVYYGGNYTRQPLIITDNKRTVTTSLWMLPPRPLSALGDMYLLPLVDDRYWWRNLTPGMLPVAAGTTWSTIFGILASTLGQPILGDAIPSVYQYVSQSLSSRFETLSPLLDSASFNVGQRVVRNWQNGNIYSYGYSSSAAIVQSNLQKVRPVQAGGSLALGVSAPSDLAAVLPAAIQVAFVKVQDQAPTEIFQALQAPLASLTVNGGPLASLAGVYTNNYTKTFRDAAGADFTGSSWSNQSECQSLVNQVATDFYSYQTASLDVKFAGINDWQPEGLSDTIEWVYTEEEVSTRVLRPPMNDTVEELLHATVSGSRSLHPLTTNSLLFRYADNSLLDPSVQTVSIDPSTLTLTEPNANEAQIAVTSSVAVQTEVGQTTSNISPISGSTPGSGPVTFYQLTGGNLTATSTSVTAYNTTKEWYAAGTWVDLIREPMSKSWFIAGSIDNTVTINVGPTIDVTGLRKIRLLTSGSPPYHLATLTSDLPSSPDQYVTLVNGDPTNNINIDGTGNIVSSPDYPTQSYCLQPGNAVTLEYNSSSSTWQMDHPTLGVGYADLTTFVLGVQNIIIDKTSLAVTKDPQCQVTLSWPGLYGEHNSASEIGPEKILNLVDSTYLTWTVVDDPTNGSIDLTGTVLSTLTVENVDLTNSVTGCTLIGCDNQNVHDLGTYLTTNFGRIYCRVGTGKTAEIDWQGLFVKTGPLFYGPEPDLEFVPSADIVFTALDNPTNYTIDIGAKTVGYTGTVVVVTSIDTSTCPLTVTSLTLTYQDGLLQSVT